MQTIEDGDDVYGAQYTAAWSLWPTGTCVVSGAGATGDVDELKVTIAAGVAFVNGSLVTVTGGTLTLDAASAFNRYDLVTVSSAGVLTVTKGTMAQKVPAIPANHCPLVIAEIDTAQTTMPSGKLFDCRLLASSLVAAQVTLDHIVEATSGHGIVCDDVLDVSAAGLKGGMVDRTGVRSLATSYQNTGAGERTVQVGLDGTGSGYFQAWISANGSNWTIATGGANAVYKVGTAFVVPSGYYYKVTATAATLDAWWERG